MTENQAEQPWSGGEISERITCVLCPNPSPMTLDGTNTWIVSEPGSDEVVVIDPGPLDEDHLDAILKTIADRGQRVGLTLLTHKHLDHCESAERFGELTGAPVRGFARGFDDDLTPGEVIRVGDVEIEAIATPGHSSCSYSFLVRAESRLLTGDTILGRGTTVVAYPDGVLADYLQSLDTIEALVTEGAVTSMLPGHGPVIEDPAKVTRYYIEHRAERLEQVREAVADGAANATEVVERVYADVPRAVWPAAESSVEAQLLYLHDHPAN